MSRLGIHTFIPLLETKKQDMEITTMNEETERVSADLLATSVSKAVLAKEVLRLKQVYSIFM